MHVKNLELINFKGKFSSTIYRPLTNLLLRQVKVTLDFTISDSTPDNQNRNDVIKNGEKLECMEIV